jgi:hypothetical protein
LDVLVDVVDLKLVRFDPDVDLRLLLLDRENLDAGFVLDNIRTNGRLVNAVVVFGLFLVHLTIIIS